jgi:hypothetical protein
MTKRSALLSLFPLFAVLTCCGSALAEEVVRYKPVVVQAGDNNLFPPKVLIVDTRDGHVWLWQEHGRKESADAAPDAQIIYQGKVVPGRAPGEAVATVKGRR